MFYIELDTIEPKSPDFIEYCRENNIDIKILPEKRWVTGWPCTRYSGTKKSLIAMIKYWWDDSYLISLIGKVL